MLGSSRATDGLKALLQNGRITTMTIQLLFFGRYQDDLGSSGEQLALPAGVATLADLRQQLATRGERWGEVFGEQNSRLLAAVNQQMATPDCPLAEGDEVAFFPPVTGG